MLKKTGPLHKCPGVYWSQVFSHLEVAPFNLSKGSSSQGSLRTSGNWLQKEC